MVPHLLLLTPVSRQIFRPLSLSTLTYTHIYMYISIIKTQVISLNRSNSGTEQPDFVSIDIEARGNWACLLEEKQGVSQLLGGVTIFLFCCG